MLSLLFSSVANHQPLAELENFTMAIFAALISIQFSFSAPAEEERNEGFPVRSVLGEMSMSRSVQGGAGRVYVFVDDRESQFGHLQPGFSFQNTL